MTEPRLGRIPFFFEKWKEKEKEKENEKEKEKEQARARPLACHWRLQGKRNLSRCARASIRTVVVVRHRLASRPSACLAGRPNDGEQDDSVSPTSTRKSDRVSGRLRPAGGDCSGQHPQFGFARSGASGGA